MARKEICGEPYLGDTNAYWPCKRKPNHKGRHRYKLTWARSEPSPPHECEDPAKCTVCVTRRIWEPTIADYLQRSPRFR